MQYKIPKSFELIGETIKVEFVDELIQDDNLVGAACYRTGMIKIQKDLPGFKRSKEQMFKTFLHEVIHWMLHKQAKPELDDDENFVEITADMLLQVLKTAKYLKESKL